MPVKKGFNLVTFKVDGADERIFLQLEGEFVLSAGVAPNVNRAIVPYTEFDKLLNADGIADLGTIEFWFSSSPEDGGEPDHKIAGVRIVDVEPVTLGEPRGQGPRIVEYRLILADMRERFAGWRGGILTDGEINAMTSPPENIRDNFRLVHDCLDAMGATFEVSGGVIGDLRKSIPMGDLTWAASSAPEELAKLLDYCRTALVVNSNAKLEVVTMGTGDDPVIPGDREIPGLLKMPGRGRRGKTVVFTSAPNPVIETFTLQGPDATTWQFVARDAQPGQGETEWPWTALADVRLLAGKGPVQTLKDDFKDAGKYREALRSDVYHYLRLSKYTKDPRVAKVLRVCRNKSKQWGLPQVSAKVAQPQADGTWKNSSEPVSLGFAQLGLDPISGEPIIQVSQLMGQVDPDGAASLQDNFKALTTKGDIEVRCSAYAATKDNKHEFFTVGFTKTPAGGLQQLSAKEVDALIAKADKDVTFIAVKEFQLHRIDGEEQNRDDLTKYAKDMADLFLRGSEAEYQSRSAAGFLAAELSGKVTEIRWNQQECKTTLKVNAWAYPSYIAGVRERLKAGGGQIFPSQNQTASSRLAVGGVGAGQSAVPVLPGAAPPAKGGSLPAGSEQFTQWTTVVPNFADWDFDRATP